MRKIALTIFLVLVLLCSLIGYSFAGAFDDNIEPMYIAHCNGDSIDGRHVFDMNISYAGEYMYDVLDNNNNVLFSIPLAQYKCQNNGCGWIILIDKSYEYYDLRYVDTADVIKYPGWFSRGKIYKSDIKFIDGDVMDIKNSLVWP